MMDEIETILKHDVEFKESERIHHRYDIGEKEYYVEQGKPLDVILDAIESLQQSLPDDLGERQEAAAEQLGFEYPIEPNQVLVRFLDAAVPGSHPCRSDADICAWKRLLGIHTGDFSAESEYYPPEPEYPSQWLEHMSEESAEWLLNYFNHAPSIPFSWSHWPEPRCKPPPEEICQNNGQLGVVVKRHDSKSGNVKSVRAMPIAFRGALELPESIEEEEL